MSLLVKNGTGGISRTCPLFPQQQTFVEASGTSALCQKQTCHTSMMLIHHEEVALAEAPPSPLRRLRGGAKGELKYRTARFIRLCPQPAPMGVDDRPANRQPHPRSAGLCGVKGIENAIELFRIVPGPESCTATRTTFVVSAWC